jgi:hypothetical protein
VKHKKKLLIGLVVGVVLALGVAGTAFAAGNGNGASHNGTQPTQTTVQNGQQAQSGTTNSTCATRTGGTCDGTCDGNQLRNQNGATTGATTQAGSTAPPSAQARDCNGTCDGTCDGLGGDQQRVRDGSSGGGQQWLRGGASS